MPSSYPTLLIATTLFTSLAEARAGRWVQRAPAWKDYLVNAKEQRQWTGSESESWTGSYATAWTSNQWGHSWSVTDQKASVTTESAMLSSDASYVIATTTVKSTTSAPSTSIGTVYTTVETTIDTTVSCSTTPTEWPSSEWASAVNTATTTWPSSEWASAETTTTTTWSSTASWTAPSDMTETPWVYSSESSTTTADTAYYTPSETTTAIASATSTVTSFPTGYTLEQCMTQADSILPDWAGSTFNYSGIVRNYYIAAEQISWNYAPSGWDNWLGVPISQSFRAAGLGYLSGTGSLGGADGLEWEKARYVGYTDSTFTTPITEPDWTGLNGPTLRAELGDMIQIVFVNKLADNYMDLHSMGLGYDKANEGSLYTNTYGPNTVPSDQPGAAVPPGACFTYKWIVGPTNAPATGFNSRLWSYHPYVNMPNDLTTGLAGPVIIYNRGTMASTMAANREFVLLFEGYAEFQSFLDSATVAEYQPQLLSALQATAAKNSPPVPTNAANASLWAPQLQNMPKLALSTAQAPTFFAMNGFIFANSPPFEMCEGDSAIWYIYAFGAQSHTFHLHGNNFQVAGEQTDFFRASVSLNNGEMTTLSMNGSRPGIWQAICHVSTHTAFGMESYYQIYEEGGCPLTALTSSGNSTIQ